MSYILTPNGRRPIVPINESAEQVNDTEMDIDFDVEHFLDYVMENFPELTEKYIEENYEQVDELSHDTLRNYRAAARSDRQHTQRFPAYMIKGDPKLRHSITKRGDSLSLAGKKLGIPGYQGKAKVLAKD